MAKKAKVGRPKGPKTVRHNIVLPVRVSKLLKKYADITNADVSEIVQVAVILLWQFSISESKKICDDAK